MASRKVRVAIIGCGQIARYLHVPDYVACPEAELVGFCDILPEKAQAMADRYAPGAKVYRDYKKMLRELKPEAVSVCVPNYLHAPITIDSLNAGCNVNVEKPMATSSAEAQRMCDAAKKNKKILNVDQSQRMYPVHIKAKEVLESGLLGKVLQVTAMFGHEGPENWSPTGKWFFRKKEARFGAMADLGVHKADIIRWLTQKEVAEVSGYFARLEKKNCDVEDNFVSWFKFTDGTMGTLAASWTVKGMEANYLILHCEKGTLRIGEIPGKPLVAELVKPRCEIVFDVPALVTNSDDDSWGLGVGGAFINAILGNRPPYCPGEEGKKSLEIILAAEKSALTKRTVTIKH